MTNNEYVALDVLVRICEAMDCGLDDIVEIEKT
jgi:DNA-binding Xre family transcriptional regulator